MYRNRSLKYLPQILLAACFAWIAFDQYKQNFLLKKNVKVPTISLDNADSSGATKLPFNDKYTILYFFKPNSLESDLTAFSVNLAKRFLPENVQMIGVALDFENEEKVQKYSAQKLMIPVVLGGEMTKKVYKIEKLPIFYMLNMENSVKFRTTGFTTPIGIGLRAYGITDDTVQDKWWLKF